MGEDGLHGDWSAPSLGHPSHGFLLNLSCTADFAPGDDVPAAGSPRSLDADPARSLQSARYPGAHSRRSDRRPIGPARPHGKVHMQTTETDQDREESKEPKVKSDERGEC